MCHHHTIEEYLWAYEHEHERATDGDESAPDELAADEEAEPPTPELAD